jgi:hypothetical protein
MASIFFTERLPGISIFQNVASSLRLAHGLFEGMSWASNPHAFVASEPEDPARVRMLAPRLVSRLASLPEFGFLKSRVYAKLLRRLILKRYQTFNGYPSQLGKGMHNIGSPADRQTAQSVSIRQGVDDTSPGNASG